MSVVSVSRMRKLYMLVCRGKCGNHNVFLTRFPVGWLRELVYHPWGRYTSRLETRHIPRVRAPQRNSSGVVYDPPTFSVFLFDNNIHNHWY